MYNCLVGAGGICRFIKINKNNFIDVNFIHSLKAPLVTRRLPVCPIGIILSAVYGGIYGGLK